MQDRAHSQSQCLSTLGPQVSHHRQMALQYLILKRTSHLPVCNLRQQYELAAALLKALAVACQRLWPVINFVIVCKVWEGTAEKSHEKASEGSKESNLNQKIGGDINDLISS